MFLLSHRSFSLSIELFTQIESLLMQTADSCFSLSLLGSLVSAVYFPLVLGSLGYSPSLSIFCLSVLLFFQPSTSLVSHVSS